MPKNTFFNLPSEKRERIIETAMNEFAKAPYQDISINHLIKCMNIPTGSFYQYFEDKTDLYFYILSFYMDYKLAHMIQSGNKMNLFDNQEGQIKQQNLSFFADPDNPVKEYRSIFIENFNKAPQKIKRDWIFENMIGTKYMSLYDYKIFDSEEIDPAVKNSKDLIMSIAMAIPNILQCFCNRETEPEKYSQLYRLCMNIIQTGIINYSPDTDFESK